MLGTSMTKKGSVNAISVATFIALIVAAILVISFANLAFAKGGLQGGEKGALRGEVVAVDNLHKMGMLTLRGSSIGNFPNDELNIFVNHDTKVKICGEREPFKDINASRNATVAYHEVSGLAVADSVSEQCS